MNTKTLLWMLGSVVGILVIVVVALLINQNSASQLPAESLVTDTQENSSTASETETTTTTTAETDSTTSNATTESNTSETETTERPTSETEIPLPVREEIRLIATYLRPGVQAGQHYVRVDETLAGPTPCLQDGLKIVLGGADLGAQWTADDRLEIQGAYQLENNTCSIVLDQATHSIQKLPDPETPTETEPERPTSDETRPPVETSQSRVSLVATVSAVRGDDVHFVVDRVVDGAFACAQTTIAMQNQAAIVVGGQYEIAGSYDPNDLMNCQLQLLDPVNGLRLLALPTTTPPIETPTATVDATGGQPFFVSAGVSFLDPMPVYSGAVGFDLTDQLRGMLTAGFGSSTIEIQLPSGEPISTNISATLVEVTGLYNVAGAIHLGFSGGMLLMSGEYDLPFPVQGSSSFNTSIPLLGVVLGYELEMVMLTVGVQIAIGG